MKTQKNIVLWFFSVCFIILALGSALPESQSSKIAIDSFVEETPIEKVVEQEIAVVQDGLEVVPDSSREGLTNTTKDTETTNQDLEEMQVHFIDVGQGDATLITCGGQALLIDAGDNNKGTAVQLYLQKQGITKLDYIIGTHPHADHIGGMDVVITKFDCGKIIMPDYGKDTSTYKDVISALEYKNYKNTLPQVGDCYTLGDAIFTIIAPNNYDYRDNINNYSVGIIIQHGEKKFLFTGDAEKEAEQDIVKNGMEIKADVYHVGHHGSKTSSTQVLLDKVQPTFAVISCGEGNSYGNPHAEPLNNLRAMDVKLFRTDEQGAIIAISDGKEITWNCAPTTTWQAGEATK